MTKRTTPATGLSDAELDDVQGGFNLAEAVKEMVAGPSSLTGPQSTGGGGGAAPVPEPVPGPEAEKTYVGGIGNMSKARQSPMMSTIWNIR